MAPAALRLLSAAGDSMQQQARWQILRNGVLPGRFALRRFRQRSHNWNRQARVWYGGSLEV